MDKVHYELVPHSLDHDHLRRGIVAIRKIRARAAEQRRTKRLLYSNETSICRICLCSSDESNMALISPCPTCRGTQQYVHLECLGRWSASMRYGDPRNGRCEICQTPFPDDVLSRLEAGMVLQRHQNVSYLRRRARLITKEIYRVTLISCCSGIVAVILFFLFFHFWTILLKGTVQKSMIESMWILYNTIVANLLCAGMVIKDVHMRKSLHRIRCLFHDDVEIARMSSCLMTVTVLSSGAAMVSGIMQHLALSMCNFLITFIAFIGLLARHEKNRDVIVSEYRLLLQE